MTGHKISRGGGNSSRSPSRESGSDETTKLSPVRQTARRGGKGKSAPAPPQPFEGQHTSQIPPPHGESTLDSSSTTAATTTRPSRGRGSRGGKITGASTTPRRGPRVRGGRITRSRNIPEFNDVDLDDDFFVAGPANFVDGAVLTKLTTRIDNGLNLINQAFHNLRQAEQELMITKAFLNQIHETTAGVTIPHGNNDDREEVSTSTSRGFAQDGDETLSMELTVPINFQMALDPFEILAEQSAEDMTLGESEAQGLEQSSEATDNCIEMASRSQSPQKTEDQKPNVDVLSGVDLVKKVPIIDLNDQEQSQEQSDDEQQKGPDKDTTLATDENNELPMDDEENTIVPESAVRDFKFIGELMLNNDSSFSKPVDEDEVDERTGSPGRLLSRSLQERKKRTKVTSTGSDSSSRTSEMSNRTRVVPHDSEVEVSLSSILNDFVPSIRLLDCYKFVNKWKGKRISATAIEEEMSKIHSEPAGAKVEKLRRPRVKRAHSPSNDNEESVSSDLKKPKTSHSSDSSTMMSPKRRSTRLAPAFSTPQKQAMWKTLKPSPDVEKILKEGVQLLKEKEKLVKRRSVNDETFTEPVLQVSTEPIPLKEDAKKNEAEGKLNVDNSMDREKLRETFLLFQKQNQNESLIKSQSESEEKTAEVVLTKDHDKAEDEENQTQSNEDKEALSPREEKSKNVDSLKPAETGEQLTITNEDDDVKTAGRRKNKAKSRKERQSSVVSEASTVAISRTPLKGIEYKRQTQEVLQTALSMFDKQKSPKSGQPKKDLIRVAESVSAEEPPEIESLRSNSESAMNEETLIDGTEKIPATELVKEPHVFVMDSSSFINQNQNDELYVFDGEPELIIDMEVYDDLNPPK